MRLNTRGKLAAVGAIALGLTLASAPAYAAPGDPMTLEIENTTFAAGSWGSGIDFTLTGAPDSTTPVFVSIGSMGMGGGGMVDGAEFTDDDGDGIITGNITPSNEYAPVAPDADGYPKYSAGAGYSYDLDGTDEYVNSNSVELTITEGAAVTGPEEVAVGQLASSAGVVLQFSGFLPNETLAGTINLWDDGTSSAAGTFSVSIGADGTGTATITAPEAAVGNQIHAVAVGEVSTVRYYGTVVEGEAPTAPTAPERVETAA